MLLDDVPFRNYIHVCKLCQATVLNGDPEQGLLFTIIDVVLMIFADRIRE